MTQLCQWISDGNTVSQTYAKGVKLQNYMKISKSTVTLEIHLFRNNLYGHSDKQICVTHNPHYVEALTHRAQNQTSETESKKQEKNEEWRKERTWQEKGCEEEGEKEEAIGGESQAGAPWHQSSGRTDGWSRAVPSSLPLLVCRQGLLGTFCSWHFPRKLHSPADSIVVPLAAALRSKHKRATMLQLRQHGKARSRVGGRDRKLTNIKRYKLQKKKQRSE